MLLAPLGLVIALFLIILVSPLWLIKPASRILGCVSIGTVLLFFNFRDIIHYRNHYYLRSKVGISDYDFLQQIGSNFEYGYDVLVFISSHLFPFEVFYVIIIASTLLCYHYFFQSYSKRNANLSFIIFTAFFLYYISFTLRSTIASALLACALVFLKNKRQYLSIFTIAIASFMHVVVLPFLPILLLTKFKKFLQKYMLLTILFFLACAALALNFIKLLSTYFFQNEFIIFKLKSYAEVSELQFSFLLLVWATIGTIMFIPNKLKNLENLWIFFLISCMLIAWSFNSFFLGRATWVVSFVYAYLIAEILSSYLIWRNTRFISYLIISIGVFSFLRFN